MKITGEVTAISDMQNGTSQAGKEWRKISVVLTYDNTKPEYPKSVVFSVMNDKIEQFNFQKGGRYDVDVDFSAREYNGKFYMDAAPWKATRLDAEQQTQQAPVQVSVQPTPAPAKDDEFPF